MKLSIVIPLYNEEAEITKLLTHLKQELAHLHISHEILVVDDGSKDDSAKRAESIDDITLLRHRQNRGYSSAIKTGIRAAQGEYILTMDADGQHDPREIKKLTDKMEDYDLVVGARDSSYKTTIGRRLYQMALRSVASQLTSTFIPDINSGFRVLKADILRKYVYLLPRGFSYSVTTTVAFLSDNRDVYFQDTITHERQSGSSKIRPIKDGMKLLVIIFRIINSFEPLRFYIPSALFFAVTSVGWTTYKYMYNWDGIPPLSLALFYLAVTLIFYGFVIDQIVKLRKEFHDK